MSVKAFRSIRPALADTDVLDHLRGGGTVTIDDDGFAFDAWRYSRTELAALLAPGERLSDRTVNGRAGLDVS